MRLLLFLALVSRTTGLLPYVKPCSRSNPHLNACLLETVRTTLPHVVAGDGRHRIQPLDPMKIDRLVLEQGSGPNLLKITISNLVVQGFKNLSVTDAGVDLERRRAHFNMVVPEVQATAQYIVKGKLMVLPVVGDGNTRSKIDDVHFNITIDFDLEKKSFKRGPEKFYLTLKDTLVDLDVGRAHVKLSNLFNGNKALGDNFNAFLNDNWRDIMTELRPSIDQTISAIVLNGFRSVQEFLPFDEMFPK